MSVSQANPTFDIRRPVTLAEAQVLTILIHAGLLAVFLILGMLGLLAEAVEAAETRADEPEVRFTFAPEIEQEQGEAAGPSELETPSAPQGAPLTETQPQPTTPETEAPPTLDQARPLVVPVPPTPQELGRPEPEPTDGPVVPSDEPPVETEETDAPSEGVEEGVTDGAGEEPEIEGIESSDTPEEAEFDPAVDDPSAQDPNEAEVDLPSDEAGSFATLEQPAQPQSSEAPALGRPFGPSLDDRISDFGRAVQRFREANPPQPSQAPSNVFEPDWPSLPPTGQALGNLTFESGDFDWEDYGRQIYWIIWRAWHNRLLARTDDFEKWAQQNDTWFLDHINGVKFTIERNGEISSIVLEMESGAVPFDLSSVEGLDEAVLPPLPDDFPRDTETVHAHFIGQGPIAQMRRALLEYKRRGWF